MRSLAAFSLVVGATLFAAPARADAPVPLRPTGTATTDTFFYDTRGYKLTVDHDLDVEALEFDMTLPGGATAAARIYDSGGTLIAAGSVANGDGTRKYVRSEVEARLYAGTVYTLAMYVSDVSTTFERRATAPSFVRGYFSSITCHSNSGDAYPSGVSSWYPQMRVAIAPGSLAPIADGVDYQDTRGSTQMGYEFTAVSDVWISGVEEYMTLPSGSYAEARFYDDAGTLLATGTRVYGDGTTKWWRSGIAHEMLANEVGVVTMFVSAPETTTAWYWSGFTDGYTLPGYATGVTALWGFDDVSPASPSAWAPLIRLLDDGVDVTLGPRTTLYQNYSSLPDLSRGQSFTAERDLVVEGFELYAKFPIGTTVTAQVYDAAGTLIDTGTSDTGDGTERWYRSELTGLTLERGESYTVAMVFSTTSGATFDLAYNGIYGSGTYDVPGMISNVRSVSGNDPSARPTNQEGYGLAFRLDHWPTDDDHDGYASTAVGGGDCDDLDEGIRPSAAEVCDANDVDEDCDGLADDLDPEGAGGTSAYYADADGDGHGGPTWALRCDPGGTYVSVASDDCDDGNPAAHPGASEVCDAGDADEDCDGAADAMDPGGANGSAAYYADADGDGHGAGAPAVLCEPDSVHVVSTSDDCADADPAIAPGAAELCDAVDNDCDGEIDEDACPSSSPGSGGCSAAGSGGAEGAWALALLLAALGSRRARRGRRAAPGGGGHGNFGQAEGERAFMAPIPVLPSASPSKG